jgi:uncharacterized protein (DUF1810 family)
MCDLERFKRAQEHPNCGQARAVEELRAGRKQGHWIWYVCPQLECLGVSATAKRFGIEDYEEALAYLRDPVLSGRFLEVVRVVEEQVCGEGAVALGVLFGGVDARKFVSSLTLFEWAARSLGEEDGSGELDEIVRRAERIFGVVAGQGYTRCATTLEELGVD